MNLLSFLKKSKTDIDIEEYAKQENIKEELENSVNSCIVIYTQNYNNETEMVRLSDFHNDILPNIGSIIWINTDNQLIPYIVIRFDYVENNIEEIYNKIYIVVRKANPTDIMQTYEY